ncbi:MAG: hypothetical protein NC913_02145, partial [Candidatus Omnitrophica bacterium]|nr:hypothetical protein [Candidatus Omnitrophota bacterium]
GVKVVLRVQSNTDIVIVDIYDHQKDSNGVKIWIETWRNGFKRYLVDSYYVVAERNESSEFKQLCTIQFMQDWAENNTDPWLHLGTAAAVDTSSMKQENDCFFVNPSPYFQLKFSVYIGQGSYEKLVSNAISLLVDGNSMGIKKLESFHKNSFKNLWANSFLTILGDDEWRKIEGAWYLWRFYLAGCTSNHMVGKFNGGNYLYNKDLRSWGGPFWFQNTRLMFWGCLKTGDDELLLRFFRLYLEALPFQKERIKCWFGHDGAIFPETMHFFGAFRKECVKNLLKKTDISQQVNPYIRWYYTGSLELLWMMINFYYHSKDNNFADTMLKPLAEAILDFFLEHFSIDKNGKLKLEPAQSLETWWDVVNPADQISGLRAVVPAMARLAKERCWNYKLQEKWEKLTQILPELPRGKIKFENGQFTGIESSNDYLAPFEQIKDPVKHNWEDPELYSIFPFDIFGLDRPEIDVAINSFQNRLHKNPHMGWSQTAIWAARLGLVEESISLIKEHIRHAQVFPSGLCWSPGNHHPKYKDLSDAPYLDSLGAICIALQEMLLQETPKALRILPAWDLSIPVRFRLRTSSAGWVTVNQKRKGDTEIQMDKPVPYKIGSS